MGTHASTDCERPDFGALYLIGAYLGASLAEAHHLLSALGLWPEGGEPLALRRRQWALLAAMRALRDTLDVPWDELAAGWVELSPAGLFALGRADCRPDVDGEVPLVDADDGPLPTLARWLDADPVELARLIDGHGRFLGLDDAAPALDADAPTLRAVRRLWWVKTLLGVSVDEFLALESYLQSDEAGADLFARERPDLLLRATRLVRWSRRLDLPLLGLLSRP